MNRAERYRARREARLELHRRFGPILAWDVALTIGLIVASMLALPVVTTLSLSASALTNGCGDTACTTTIGIGVLLGTALPLLVLGIGGVVSVVRLVRHRRGWKTGVVTIVSIALCLPLAWGVALVATRL